MITYEMLTGRLPFGEAFDRCENAQDFSRLKYEPAYWHNPMVPAWMDQALERALSPLPEHRQDAMSEFIFDLQRPNTEYKQSAFVPLSQRNPLKFWQGLALLEAVMIAGFMYFILRS